MDNAELFAECAKRLGLPQPIDHFYLPIVRPQEARDARCGEIPLLEPSRIFNVPTIRKFAREISRYYDHTLPTHDEVKALGLGLGYSDIECYLYHAIVRCYHPSTIIEIGCGVSTWFGREGSKGTDCRVICVEPYPAPAFPDWCRENNVELWQDRFQDVIPHLPLNGRVILFVDCTHVAKITSELHRVFLDLMPALSPGSLVHFHDILLPFACLHSGHNSFDHTVNWYESTLLGIFLATTHDYESVFPQYWLGRTDSVRPILEDALPAYRETHSEGSAFWIRKRLTGWRRRFTA
jgi:hypothetical protein